MPGPRRKFRERPKKSGAKKKQRVRSQKRRIIAAGADESTLKKMTNKEVREALKTANRKKQ